MKLDNTVPPPPSQKAVKKSSYFSFKAKNPISNFTEVFFKRVDQQWFIARAMFLNLIIQAINLGLILLTQKSLWIRIELEENEIKRALWGLLFHIAFWIMLCHLRRKNFTMPKVLGYLCFNIFALSYFYLQSYILTANTLGDPNSKVIYACFSLSDCFFGFFYVLMNDQIHPSGHFGFCVFPKFFFAISFLFFFNDRSMQILQFYITTSIISYLQGVLANELLADCEYEEITEFHTLDYYTLLYLDIFYIAHKCFDGVKFVVESLRERMFSVKKYGPVAEEDDVKENDKSKTD